MATTLKSDEIQSELNFYRQNQSVVEVEIKKVIEDNQKLSQQVESLLREKLQNTWPPQNNNIVDQIKELDDLKKQIVVVTKERDSLHVLWLTSQKTIEALEMELKTYQSCDGNQNMHDDIRNSQLKLNTALQDYLDLEVKNKDINSKYNSIESELKIKRKEILSYKERGKVLEDQLMKITLELDEHKINLAAEKKNNNDVREQIRLYQKESAENIKKELEAKSKVAEALQLFDLVSKQKNEALKRINELLGELSEFKKQLAHLRQDIESQCRKEMDEVKEKYNEKLTDMLHHIRNLDTELVDKGMLLNKTLRENKILQKANDIYLKQQQENLEAVNPKLAIADQKVEAMLQELVLSERRNIQLTCDKQCLTFDIHRIQDMHARDTKRRDWEESLLKGQVEELRLQVEHLKKSLNETHNMISKLQVMLSSRTELNQKIVSTKEHELMELNKHLEKQIELNKKWKTSYIEMTEKLKKKMLELETENKEMKNKLQIPHQTSSEHSSS